MELSHSEMTADLRRAARLAVVKHATDPADLAQLLDILDLCSETDRPRADRSGADRLRADRSGSDRSRADQDKAGPA